MSNSLTPLKRPSDGNLAEQNGKRKAQSSVAKSPNDSSSKSSVGNTIFRVLCPASKVDAVMGDGGAFILQIREEAGSKIQVEEPVPGCDERVIIITAAFSEYGSGSEKKQENKCEEDNGIEGDEDTKEHGKDDEIKKALTGEDSNAGMDGTSLQKALLLVFEKLIEGESVTENGNGDSDESAPSILRLLVLSGQVGCLLGKAGSVIKQMSTNSGAEIRILPKDKLPLLASASDELVQITGEVDAVRKALQSVSQQLIENANRGKEASLANPSGLSSHSSGNSNSRQEAHHASKHFAAQKAAPFAARPRGTGDFHPHIPPIISRFHESDLHARMKPSLEMLSFRLLCNSDRVGGIIGKGGTVVNIIQQETGCEIQVVEGTPESEDRIIVISGPAHPEDRVSAVQDALLRVQNRILRPTSDNKEDSVMARILVSSSRVGCLLGKGGSIISEMRKSSGAHIRILGKDQIPKCASEDEEVVQVNGGYDAVQEALLQITDRLKVHFFRDVFASIDHPPNPALFDSVPPLPSFMRRRELSPPSRMYPNFGPSAHKFDPVGGPGRFHTPDDHPPFVRDIFQPGLPPHMPERRPWGPEGPMDEGGPFGFPDFPGGPPRRPPGFVGGAGPAIITSTTIEVAVPSSVVPSIYGEDGYSLKQIRTISNAKVTITDPKPEATETMIVISGTPEQTHAAQSLIQAFVMLENEET